MVCWNPVFIPLGESSVYLAWHEPSVYPAWRQAQVLSRLAGPVFIPLGRPSVYPAWRAQCLSRLASPGFIPLGGPSVYPAWRQAQCLSRLTRCPIPNRARKNPFPRLRRKVAEGRKGGIKKQNLSPWRLPTNPAFIPLGGQPRTQYSSRLAAIHKPSVYLAWRGALCLSRLARVQCLSRLA